MEVCVQVSFKRKMSVQPYHVLIMESAFSLNMESLSVIVQVLDIMETIVKKVMVTIVMQIHANEFFAECPSHEDQNKKFLPECLVF